MLGNLSLRARMLVALLVLAAAGGFIVWKAAEVLRETQSELARVERAVADLRAGTDGAAAQPIEWALRSVNAVSAEAEVDRTIVWPAHGMADAVGALELAAARADAERAMGARFSRQAFHDRLLASGPVPLATMRRAMLEWALSLDPAPPLPPREPATT